MPNFKYKCVDCKKEEVLTYPVGKNPNYEICSCGENMRTVIGITSTVLTKSGRVFAGDWYKKTYGEDIAKGYEDKARQAESRKTLEKELRKQLKDMEQC